MAWLTSSCVATRVLGQRLDATDGVLAEARKLNADKCAPEAFANAVSDAGFARIEFRQGNARRALMHTDSAELNARAALEASEACGGQDYDGDGIADVIDRCPNEPEDFDGIRDEDGCPDLDPYADEDGDGIRNIDDSCVDQAEDFDGHNDGDGCPETSQDSDGDSIIDALDQCPEVAEDLDGFKDGDGCPEDDNDNDMILDSRDECPNATEDLDDWEDEDGCPELDNDGDTIDDLEDRCPNDFGDVTNGGCPLADGDGDGVSDENDECPNEQETRNGYLDADGCPDESNERVRLTRLRIELIEPVRFDQNTATIKAESYAVLADAAKVLSDVPNIRIRIEGHTDSRGDETELTILSLKRADAVRAYLTQRGIDPSRLDTEGFGPSKPVDTNRTERGRKANRRIELVIDE
jgi:outer membrane protein OmpA-like peptidoglycan-associated protein